MKAKLLLSMSLVMLLCVAKTQAQYLKVGDLIILDSINAYVLSIDETGKHGLAISQPAIFKGTKKRKAEKKAEEENGLSDIYSTMNQKLFVKGLTMKKTAVATTADYAIPEGVISKLGKDGEENQKAIVSYCQENGVNIEKAFPFQAWAAQLGDGWFIPGDNELELYATAIYGGVGKEYKKGFRELMKESHSIAKEGSAKAKEGDMSGVMSSANALLSPFYYSNMFGLLSSSSKCAKCGFRKLVPYQTKLGKCWVEIVDKKNSGQLIEICAVRRF